ncbi:hypothetical protein ACFS7Z_26790 [Pontibacter toksunensis]|uniref:Uncharacterized protein n=1 Tax=Pontibacter toksunensis TaxID=1332631 RepID=A0ABW6C3S7_9BACT
MLPSLVACTLWRYGNRVEAETVALVLVLGILSFTLLEYVAHRIFFHMPPTSRWREKVQ